MFVDKILAKKGTPVPYEDWKSARSRQVTQVCVGSRYAHANVQRRDGNVSCATLLDSQNWSDRIHRKARRLRRRPLFRCEDLDDIEQELWIGIWMRLGERDLKEDQVDPYFQRALNHSAASLIRKVEGKQRSFTNGMASLEDSASSFTCSITTNSHQVALSTTPRDLDLQIDIRELMKDAPERARSLCAGLMETTRAGYARQLGMARGSTYRDLKRARLWIDSLRPGGASL